MSFPKLLILHGVNVLIVVVLVGLIVRRRMGRSLLFASYMAAVLVASVLIGLWPSRFYSWGFWTLKETVFTLLKFSIALEIALRIFRVLPGAMATARVVFLLVLVVTAAAAFVAPVPAGHQGDVASRLLPRVTYGTAWLFAGLLAVVLRYHVPLDRLDKAILIGFVPYLLVFTVAVDLLRVLGWEAIDAAGYANTLAYMALIAYWATVVWRADPVQTHEPEDLRVVHWLQPWR